MKSYARNFAKTPPASNCGIVKARALIGIAISETKAQQDRAKGKQELERWQFYRK